MPAPALDPTIPLNRALITAQTRHQIFPKAQDTPPLPVVMGVSGGADSVCLLHLLAGLAPVWNLSLHVAHLDHNVRPGSAEDAEFVAHLAAALGLPYHTRQLSPAGIAAADNNLEAGLRRLRYRFFADIAASLVAAGEPLPTVAVAHTADDQAETILMHVLRGSGLAGLAGMRPVTLRQAEESGQRPLRVARPLLDVQRTQILHYLNERRLAWREDPSNQSMTFTRNRLRQQILPPLREIYPNLTGALTRLGAVMDAENERAKRANEEAFSALRQDSAPAPTHPAPTPVRVVLDRNSFQALDVATQRGVLRLAAVWVGAPAEAMSPEAMGYKAMGYKAMGYERTESLRDGLIGNSNFGPTPLTGEIAWSATEDRFSLHRQTALAFLPETPFLDEDWRTRWGNVRVQVGEDLLVGGWLLHCEEVDRSALPPGWRDGGDPWQTWCDARQVGELLLTTPRQGQRIAPLGMAGHHKQLGDFFTDCKVPIALRAGWPTLVDGASGDIVWLCGLRLAHQGRIRPETKSVLHLTWRKG